VIVEELLETLVGEVNAELLERVDNEDLKTGNIEDANEAVLGSNAEGQVNLLDNPQEHTTIEGLNEGITGISSLLGGKLKGDEVTTGEHAGSNEGSNEGLSINLEEGSNPVDDDAGINNLRGLITLELDVTEVEDGSADAEDHVLLVLAEAEDVQGIDGASELLDVIHALNGEAVGDLEVVVILGSLKVELLLAVLVEGSNELVENVEGTLVLTTVDNTRLLEEVRDDRGTRDSSVLIEGNLNELTETGRVVVLGGLSVTKSLEERIGLEELLLELTLSTLGTSDGSEVLNDLLSVLSLTGTRLTSDKHGLGLTLVMRLR